MSLFVKPRGSSRGATGGNIAGTSANAANADTNEMLRAAFESNAISASRRYIQEARQKGVVVTDSEARAAIIARAEAGDLSDLPQYARIKNRIEGNS
jgi:hypothetical protein